MKTKLRDMPVPDPYCDVGDEWTRAMRSEIRHLARETKTAYEAGGIEERNILLEPMTPYVVALMNRHCLTVEDAYAQVWVYCATTIAEETYDEIQAMLRNKHRAKESELAHAS